MDMRIRFSPGAMVAVSTGRMRDPARHGSALWGYDPGPDVVPVRREGVPLGWVLATVVRLADGTRDWATWEVLLAGCGVLVAVQATVADPDLAVRAL